MLEDSPDGIDGLPDTTNALVVLNAQVSLSYTFTMGHHF
jgi:hypothetical protein